MLLAYRIWEIYGICEHATTYRKCMDASGKWARIENCGIYVGRAKDSSLSLLFRFSSSHSSRQRSAQLFSVF